MLKFIRGKAYQPTAERLKLQKELFAFSKVPIVWSLPFQECKKMFRRRGIASTRCHFREDQLQWLEICRSPNAGPKMETTQHGFPHRPSALAWDPQLQLMAIGTRTGVIKIYGSPGVELCGHHQHDCTVVQLFCLPGQGRFISLCDDNSLHLWEINPKDGRNVLEEVKSCSLEERLKKISTCCLQSSGEHLLIGTEVGNIYLLDIRSFEVTNNIIYQDVVMQNVPPDYRVSPGAVEAIAEHPTSPNKILIGYNRGLLVLWDNEALTADHTYVGSQQLESVCWHRKGNRFMSSHNDGSYIIWNTNDPSKPESGPVTQYGPFPCKAINKILWRSAKSDDFVIFSGGMPRANYGDRHTISVINGESKHVAFDFTSRIVDFFTISDTDEECEWDDPHSLVVLAEEEMVVLDLCDDNWAPFRAPYLASLHSSAITCAQHFSDIGDDLWNKFIAAGEHQAKEPCSAREWPITGGKNLMEASKTHDLLLTGHEDGTINFWDASASSLKPMYKLGTAFLFSNEEGHEQQHGDDTEEWPPFRKVGCFDPYSDDPRLAIRKIALCPYNETLVIAGTAGQVLIMSFSSEEIEKEVESSVVNIVNDRDGFVWKGHDRLMLKKGPLKFVPGFCTDAVMQMHPPAAVTALAVHSDWGLVAAGTAHGFGLFDFIQNKIVTTKCTLNPNDLTGAGDTTMSRRKSFKKSLRESFRRLRRGRSRRNVEKSPTRSSADGSTSHPVEVRSLDGAPSTPETKPIERAIEARSSDDSSGSMVRCLYMTKTFIVNVSARFPTLWAGTNSGAIYVFTIAMPAMEKRNEADVHCRLGKEIQLKHKAPVVAMTVVDAGGVPLSEPGEKKVEHPSPHRVVICSEEQFKVFSLPSLKPYGKFKLTAHEGSRIRKIGFLAYRSRADPNYVEHCVTCLTNQGDLSIYSIPDLRRQITDKCIRREDINGISSLIFTRNGQGFYLHSSSEFQRFSLSASSVNLPKFSLDLPPNARPLALTPLPRDNLEKVDEEEEEEVTSSPLEASDSKDDEISDSRLDTGNASSGDITVDSVKDHLMSSPEEIVTRITEHTEQKVEVKREETIMTIETTILTSQPVITEAGLSANASLVSSTQTGSAPLPSTQPLLEINRILKAPLATIDELHLDDVMPVKD